MNKSFYIKFSRSFCAALCLIILGSILTLCAGAELIREYTVTVDHPVSITANQMPVLIKDHVHGTDPELKVEGWVKTNQVIESYEYTIDGGKTWKCDQNAVVARPDVQKYCPATYKTAGFHISIDVLGLARGKYDLFVRAITKDGDIIEVLAMLDVVIGKADTETVTYRELNLNAYGAQNDVLTLKAGEELSLDAYNLRDFQSFEIILNQQASLTLKSTEQSAISFRKDFQAEQGEDGTFYAVASLLDEQYAGKLILTSDLDVQISRMRLYSNVPDYYQGELTVHMSATPFEYLGSANAVDATVMSDDTVGTFIRLFPAMDTGDPYIYFNLGKYLKETKEVQINADDYRYAVISLQTPVNNPDCEFALFLCAGDIHGPNGDSRIAFTPKNDGEWHKYIIPLYKEEHWTGTVYGMRFDFVEGSVNTSHYANIASVELYPDEASAKDAAARDFEVYHEAGKIPEDIYQEEGRAPSGRADAITWFDPSLTDCFGGEHKSIFSFDEYGHLILQAAETTNDPYVSFDLQRYAEINGTPLLKAQEYGIIVLRIMADKKIDGKGFTLYYYSGGLNFAQGERAVSQTYQGGEWEYLVYDMHGKNAWTDEILGMRLDYAQQIAVGQRVCLSDMLFFKDEDAWLAYAKEHGIEIPGFTPPANTEEQTPAPETEVPTIEIPTAGPGLEYIPPEQFTENSGENGQEQGCKTVIFLPILCIVSLSAVALIKNKTEKGELS